MPISATDDGTHDRLAFGEDQFQTGPGLFATGLVAADDGFTEGVLDALQIDLDVVADLGQGRAVALAEFAHRDAAFGLEADVDDDDVFFDADDETVDDLAFAKVAALQLFVEQRGEIVTGGGEGLCIGHGAMGFLNGLWRVTGRPRAR